MSQESQFERAVRDLREHIERTQTQEYQAWLARQLMNDFESNLYRELRGSAPGLLDDIFGFPI